MKSTQKTPKKHDWIGKSGIRYTYNVYPIRTNFKALSANYIFAKKTAILGGGWAAIYIGETEDLSERFDGHHKTNCIASKGATHIHVRQNKYKRNRLKEEADLMDQWKPPCNG